MRILLTGATGFVGRAFLASVNAEDEVVCLGRSRGQVDKGSFYKTDIGNRQSVDHVAKIITGSFDALVHMAAYVPKTREQDILTEANQVNVNGLINILEAFGERFNKIILGSSAEVYDLSVVGGKISEDNSVNPGSYYGATKLASEFIARTYGKKHDKVTTILRFSVMYGPHDQISRALPNFINAAIKNEEIKIAGGQYMRDYIHIDDVTASIHAALEKNYAGVVNIGTGQGVSIEEAAQFVIRGAHSNSKIVSTSFSEGVDIIIDPEKAASELGFKATIQFPEKLEDMIESYR